MYVLKWQSLSDEILTDPIRSTLMTVIGKIIGKEADGPLSPPAVWNIVQVALCTQLEFDPTDKTTAPKVAACQRAVEALVTSKTAIVNLAYGSAGARLTGVPSNMQELVGAIIAASPTLTKVNADILARKAKEAATAAEALIKARAEFVHIQNGTAAGRYGEKLRGLIDAGYVKLATPHRTYMSSHEKGQSRDGIAKSPFGVSRRITGIVANEWPADKKLVLHQHCNSLGGIIAASIKYEAQEEEKGGGLALEEANLQYFQDQSITRQKLM
jgi:hypothetical protein